MTIDNHIDPLIVKVEGEGGRGGSSVGEILARSAARSGYYIQCSRAFPAEIKGGRAWFQLKASSRPLSWWGGSPHILLKDARGGEWKISLQMDAASEPLQADFSPLKVAKSGGNARNSNIVALGFVAGTLGLGLNVVLTAARQRYARRGEDKMDELSTMIRAGYEGAVQLDGWKRWQVTPPPNGRRRLIINGNEAIALGALAAGVRYFAGYPITPASSILELMLRELPHTGGVAMQMEDEMAALASCLGASYAGRKAMCATSGPGFALMSELFNLAVMAELPITVVDVQRSGPATGQPSKSEQADLLYAIHGSPGDVQRIVLAPSTVEEALYMTVEAVNLSERYQMPVIMLSDAALSNRIEAIPEPDWDSLLVVKRERAKSIEDGAFQRYLASATGVSGMPLPGEDDQPYIATSMEHDETGKPSGDLEVHYRMTDKRLQKFHSSHKTLIHEPVYHSGGVDAGIGVVGWGSTRGAISTAVERLDLEEIPLASAQVRYLNPLPLEKLAAWMKPLKIVIVAEENRTGQLAQLIRHLAPEKIITLCPKDEASLTPEFIMGAVKDILANHKRDNGKTPNGAVITDGVKVPS